jgi:hypothetical protein
MRFPPLLTLLSALASTALMFMVLLAGYTTSTLPTLDMFTVSGSLSRGRDAG